MGTSTGPQAPVGRSRISPTRAPALREAEAARLRRAAPSAGAWGPVEAPMSCSTLVPCSRLKRRSKRFFHAFTRSRSRRVDVLSALGRVLAEPVVSSSTRSAVAELLDGWLRRPRSRTRGRAPVGSPWSAGSSPASMPSAPLHAGEAIRIFTGAPLPEGADAVVPQEDVAADNGRITIAASVRPVRTCARPERTSGAGDVVAPAQVIDRRRRGRAAGNSRATRRCASHRRPRVAILSTGNELADLGTEPGPGQIPNTNTYSLMAQVIEAGAEPINLGVAPDQLDAITERVRWGLDARRRAGDLGRRVGRRARPGARRARALRRRAAPLAGVDATGQAHHVSARVAGVPCSACPAILSPRW